jgi:hypothetical protein
MNNRGKTMKNDAQERNNQEKIMKKSEKTMKHDEKERNKQ